MEYSPIEPNTRYSFRVFRFERFVSQSIPCCTSGGFIQMALHGSCGNTHFRAETVYKTQQLSSTDNLPLQKVEASHGGKYRCNLISGPALNRELITLRQIPPGVSVVTLAGGQETQQVE